MFGRRIGAVLAAVGTALSLAGAGMYVLPGPGLPVLAIGLASLITGLIVIAATRRNCHQSPTGARPS
ncbi:hypothetical protein [Streptomyces wuyuanensis]|uniref:Uncharacterized protein n=1 Tax=Streptomyces wuyuanensis TaxID=1196353 RepID=A0A1G9YCP7_9ACTN|nr:hypothetical protein [Streptomyces wuyuanensis]SDN06727.1 hypothetical protein SAMN05444921_11867 [Streptomyces wuyuanensis]